MPYVRIGFILVLYIKSLFSIDSCDFLPSSQYNSFTLSSICFLFIKMVGCHDVVFEDKMSALIAGNEVTRLGGRQEGVPEVADVT